MISSVMTVPILSMECGFMMKAFGYLRKLDAEKKIVVTLEKGKNQRDSFI